MRENDKPLLTAAIFTYNHEKTIERCIRSLVEQETNYPYVIHICDDCSKDGTTAICRKYAKKYPAKIVLFEQKENTFLKPYDETQSFQEIKRINTKYFCIIEGDDCWTDKNKIQIALDFLENNPEYIGFAHDTLQVNEFDKTKLSYVHDIMKYDVKNPVTLGIDAPFFLTSSRIFRNCGFKDVGIWPVDYLVYNYHLAKGPIHYCDKIMAEYTFGYNGTWASLGYMGSDMNGMFSYKLSRLFSYKHDDYCTEMQKWYDTHCGQGDKHYLRLLKFKKIFGVKVGWTLWFIHRFVRKYGFESMSMNYVYPRKIVKQSSDRRFEQSDDVEQIVAMPVRKIKFCEKVYCTLGKMFFNRKFIKGHTKWFLKILFLIVKVLPEKRVKVKLNETTVFNDVFIPGVEILRTVMNTMPVAKRDKFAKRYIIPMVNMLFDKNRINYAQYLLFAVEEWFLSKNTEEDFENALNLFSEHAIQAGLRFREKYPLPEIKHKNGKTTVAFVNHWVGQIGFEVVIGLGKYLKKYSPSVYGSFVYNPPDGEDTVELWKRNGIKVVSYGTDVFYNVFKLRQLFIDNPVDVAMWVTPPMHMFFNFSFGFAPKQVFFSQYIHPNLKMEYLDDCLTLGGAGKITERVFNGRKWNIIPQITYVNDGSEKVTANKIVLFAPARVEKIKQPEYLETVKKIMKKCPNTIFKWTGAVYDPEVKFFFDKLGWHNRNEYIPWMNNEELIQQIKDSDVILETFPIGFGTTCIMAAQNGKPIISMYSERNPLYWRDCYWEAKQGNEDLRKICMDKNGRSKVRINRNKDEYIADAVKVINSPSLAKQYAKVYKDAFDYAYFNNPNDVSKIFSKYVEGLYEDYNGKKGKKDK